MYLLLLFSCSKTNTEKKERQIKQFCRVESGLWITWHDPSQLNSDSRQSDAGLGTVCVSINLFSIYWIFEWMDGWYLWDLS